MPPKTAWDARPRYRQAGSLNLHPPFNQPPASVAGGGPSILIGGPLVTETKKHTKLLEAIKVATGKKPTVKVSGNVEAVIERRKGRRFGEYTRMGAIQRNTERAS